MILFLFPHDHGLLCSYYLYSEYISLLSTRVEVLKAVFDQRDRERWRRMADMPVPAAYVRRLATMLYTTLQRGLINNTSGVDHLGMCLSQIMCLA